MYRLFESNGVTLDLKYRNFFLSSKLSKNKISNIIFFENNFNGTLSKSGLKAINNRVSNLSSFVFEVNLFSKKLDKFGTTGDEQPLSNFFDLNTALKIINSKNYTGQITTNELETDGFLN